jgi:2-polyprenyl-3-methyl-5-hydroxy-6-metoxy-1,4-benzoquinol methylase
VPTTEPDTTADTFAGRIFESVLGAIDTWSIYIGDKFGAYEALAGKGAMTRSELAARTGLHRRYAHEWLEQEVTTGILIVDDATAAPDDRRYSIPDGHAEVLTDKDSLAYLTPFVRLIVAGGIQIPALMEAYRTGGGVSWAEFGEDMRSGQAEMNRPWFLSEIGTNWFPSVPTLQDKLTAGGRVADVGCGEGWSTIAIAKAYPNTIVEGFDIDEPSIEAARRNAAAEGVADRVTFHLVDAGSNGHSGEYDVVAAFECIHDLPQPVKVLSFMRRLAGEDGQVVVMDEAVGEAFGERTDEVERLMYGFSLFVCLPDGMSHPGSVGTGTVMRPSELKAYAQEAGFADVEVLPIENELWRFYGLV